MVSWIAHVRSVPAAMPAADPVGLHPEGCREASAEAGVECQAGPDRVAAVAHLVLATVEGLGRSLCTARCLQYPSRYLTGILSHE